MRSPAVVQDAPRILAGEDENSIFDLPRFKNLISSLATRLTTSSEQQH